MALFRRLFYRKPPDHLLEITERVYVFDCCFSSGIMEEDEYRDYMDGIVAQLQSYFPEASFMVFNFREGERKSQISEVLLQYDITVMNYPQRYVGCPLLPFEIVHQFLRACDSWLSLGGQQNVLLMHCERGGWPVLAFMLAGLLLYKKQYIEEQRTLELVYKQAPTELLHFFSPLDPQPSHVRYLRYISIRGSELEEPLLDLPFTVACLVLRVVPNFDGQGGCRPLVRVYGQDPLMPIDRTPKLLFSTFKTKEKVRYFRQADSSAIKLDVDCCVQGDVVLECIHMDEDLEHEEIMFRVMFNTAFVQFNSLLLDHEDIDVLWKTKDQFAEHFKAEVLFSDFDAGSSTITEPAVEDDDETETEEFFEAEEIFSNPEWNDGHRDPDVNKVPITYTLEDDNHESALENSNPETEATSIFELSSSDQDLDIISSAEHRTITNNASLMPEIFMEKAVENFDSSNLKHDKSFDRENFATLNKIIMETGNSISVVGEKNILESSTIKQDAVDILNTAVEDLAISETNNFKTDTEDIVSTVISDYTAHKCQIPIADEAEIKLENSSSRYDIGSDLKEKKCIHDDMNSRSEISNTAGENMSCKLEDMGLYRAQDCNMVDEMNIKPEISDSRDTEHGDVKHIVASKVLHQKIESDITISLTPSKLPSCNSDVSSSSVVSDTEIERHESPDDYKEETKSKTVSQLNLLIEGFDDVVHVPSYGTSQANAAFEVETSTVPTMSGAMSSTSSSVLTSPSAPTSPHCMPSPVKGNSSAASNPSEHSPLQSSRLLPSPPIALSPTKFETFSISSSFISPPPHIETRSIPKVPAPPPPPPFAFGSSVLTCQHSISSPPPTRISATACDPLLHLSAERLPLLPSTNFIPSPPPPPSLAMYSRSSIKGLPLPLPQPPPPPPQPPSRPPFPPSNLAPTFGASLSPPASIHPLPPIYATPSPPPFPSKLQEMSTKKPPSRPSRPMLTVASYTPLPSSPSSVSRSEAFSRVPPPPLSRLIWNKSDAPPTSLPLAPQVGVPQDPFPLSFTDCASKSSVLPLCPPQPPPLKFQVSIKGPSQAPPIPPPPPTPPMVSLTVSKVIELAIPTPPLTPIHRGAQFPPPSPPSSFLKVCKVPLPPPPPPPPPPPRTCGVQPSLLSSTVVFPPPSSSKTCEKALLPSTSSSVSLGVYGGVPPPI